MIRQNTPLDRLIIVDNGSSDGTREYIAKLPLGGHIFNSQNLGCGVAWNQGALYLQAEWTIIMNNDVIVSQDWINKLICAAERLDVKVISPALIEGVLDYDFDEFEKSAFHKMQNTHRIGSMHAVCLAVHNSVWMDVGYFSAVPKLFGYEDTLFFNDLKKLNIQTAITGACWLHHFGSITQKLMKQEQGLNNKDGLSNRYSYKLLGQSWLERKLNKLNKLHKRRIWSKSEQENFGISLHGLRKNGQFNWI
jgi:glycosyltransferase involved in cell wall biosynthesis